MATKPTDYLNWIPDNSPEKISEPTTEKKELGWIAEEKPPFQWFNWLFNNITRWFGYFEETTDDLLTDLSAAEGDIAALQSLSTSQGSSISTLQTEMDTAQSDIDALESSMGTAQSNITALGTDKLDKAGGTMTGFIVLHANPSASMNPATKAYVDSSAGGVVPIVKNANYTAVANDQLLADTSAGVFTITLPASPTVGLRLSIYDSQNTWATNNLTVARNSSNIDGAAADLTCNVGGGRIDLIYCGGSRGWGVFV